MKPLGRRATQRGRANQGSRTTYPDEAVGLFKIVAPVRTERLLAADVPEVQLVAVVLKRLDVESKRWRDGGDVLVVELLHNGRLARVVQAKHQQAHLMLLLLELPHDGVEAHGGGAGQATRGRWRGDGPWCWPRQHAVWRVAGDNSTLQTRSAQEAAIVTGVHPRRNRKARYLRGGRMQ